MKELDWQFARLCLIYGTAIFGGLAVAIYVLRERLRALAPAQRAEMLAELEAKGGLNPDNFDPRVDRSI